MTCRPTKNCSRESRKLISKKRLRFAVKPWFKTSAKYAITAAILFFLLERLLKSYRQIASYEFHINYIFIAIAIISGLIGFLMLAFGWKLCLNTCGGNLKKGEAILIWFKSQMAKYLPGTVWYFICRVHDCSKKGLTKTISLSSMFLESVMLGASSLLLAAALIMPEVSKYIPWYLLLPAIFAGLIAMHPKIINCIASVFKKDVKLIHASYSHILLILAYYIL